MAGIFDMTEQLKACQCGKEPILHPHHIPGYAVTCPCGLCTVPFATREEATACWNHRPEEDRLRAVIEAQREVIEALELLNTLELRPGEQANAFHTAWRTAETARAKLKELEGE